MLIEKNKRIPISEANLMFFIIGALGIFAGIPMSIKLNLTYGDNIWINFLQMIVNQGIFIFLPVIFYLNYKSKTTDVRHVLRLNPISRRLAGLIVIISICTHYVLSFFNTVVIYLLGLIGKIPDFPVNAPSNFMQLLFSIIIISAFPAVCEELLARGIILNAYERRGTYKAIIISALFFGLFHFDIRNFLSPVIFGLIAGYIVVRTNSIYAGMLAHFINNAFAEILHFFSEKGISDSVQITLQEVLFNIPVTIVVSIILFGLLKLISLVTKKDYQPPITNTKNDIVAIVTHWPVAFSIVMYLSVAVTFIFTLMN